jgi:hypothetical protein
MPDLYVYEFNRNQVAKEIDLDIKDDELGQFFSDFMKGKNEEFSMDAEYRDREQTVFGTVEKINMDHFRALLNISLYILGGALISAAACGWFFWFKKMKYELRIAFKGGIFTQAVLLVIGYVAFNFHQIRAFFYNWIFNISFGADDVLPVMLTKEFAFLSLVAISTGSLIILAILASAVWRLTKPRRMFW